MDVALLKSIAAALWPAAAAMLGAWIGARMALRRYKSERAFDRRIDWHERTCRLLHRIRWHLQAGTGLDRAHLFEAAREEYRKAFALADELSVVTMDAELYGGQQAVDALEALMHTLNTRTDSIRPFTPEERTDPSKTEARIRAALEEAVAIAKTVKVIAGELRGQLGLPPLQYPTFAPFAGQPPTQSGGAEGINGAPGPNWDSPVREPQA